jgi:hypothetical protein
VRAAALISRVDYGERVSYALFLLIERTIRLIDQDGADLLVEHPRRHGSA